MNTPNGSLLVHKILSLELINDNAIFRNPSDLQENPVDIDEAFDINGNIFDKPEDLDLIQPLLPPHINYDKVNKYGQVNHTDNLFQTFYFHPSFSNIVLLGLLIIFTMWVVGMNLLTILGLWRTHRKGHMADLYLANLAVGDTLLGILILPLMSVVILLGYFPFNGQFGRFVCDLWVFLDYYLIVASSFGSCALMCNYLWMIRCPSSFPVDVKHHILAIAFCWIAVNLSWTPSFFNDRLSTYYPDGQCGFSISRNQYFSFYIGISGFYIPLAVSLLCGIWSLAGIKRHLGIPLLSWRQSLSIGRRKRSSRLITSMELGDDEFEQEIRKHKRTKKAKVTYAPEKSKYYDYDGRGHKRPYLKHQKHQKQMITSETDPKVISQVAKDHYPLVVSSLLLFIVCRSLFYVYFGVGSFVHNFFPLDLSNGVYWLMHSNAAISPLIHFAFDPELRHEVIRILGVKRNPQRSPIVEPESIIISRILEVKRNPQRSPIVEPESIIISRKPIGGISGLESSSLDDGVVVPTISIGTDRGRSVKTLEHFMYPNPIRLQQQIINGRDIRRSPPENGIRL